MLNAAAIAGGLGAALPQTFCLPLMSGIVGVNASKMIPVGSLRAPISLQIYTAANDDAIFYGVLGVGATWQIINVEFVATYVEILDDNFAQHFDPTIPQYISTKSWRESSFVFRPVLLEKIHLYFHFVWHLLLTYWVDLEIKRLRFKA